MRRKKKGWVYPAIYGELNQRKIGFTTNLKKRMDSLQTGSVKGYRLDPDISPIEGCYRRHETRIHELLKPFKVPGRPKAEFYYWIDEAKMIFEKFRQEVCLEGEELLPLFKHANDELRRKYDLYPKWNIKKLIHAPETHPGCQWEIEGSNGPHSVYKTHERAANASLEWEYRAKNARPFTLEDLACYGSGNDLVDKQIAEAMRQGKLSSSSCWMPDDLGWPHNQI